MEELFQRSGPQRHGGHRLLARCSTAAEYNRWCREAKAPQGSPEEKFFSVIPLPYQQAMQRFVSFKNPVVKPIPALDFAKATAQKQSQVTLPASNFYAQWRLRTGTATTLRDDSDPPPERLLQAIWLHQRLQRDQLHTLDGQPVRVLHPGFLSVEGGPDFRGAVLQIGDVPVQAGDVEVDLRASGWRAHGHDKNPAFKNVLLHVVWDGDRSGGGSAKTLALRTALDAPLGELSVTLDREPANSLPENLRGKCSASLRELSETDLSELLQQAARVRFESKAAQFQARAKQAGWEQALWEGLFRAAGYKHNVWPMQCLAEAREHWSHRDRTPLTLQARLLGLSGLLPIELTRKQAATDGYVRRVWDCWWRERDEFSDAMLPRSLWRFHGLRPANHPQRRLALIAHWVAQNKLPGALEKWCAAEIADRALQSSLLEIFRIERDEFWSWHWTFRSARLKKPQPLIGATRVTDLAINVALPWLWTRAVEGKNAKLRNEIERRYFAWPAAEDNSVLRLARQRLFSSASPKFFRRASQQQGLIQIVRDFCDHSNAVCDQCEFPDLVKQWKH
jgi:hypothetical protein